MPLSIEEKKVAETAAKAADGKTPENKSAAVTTKGDVSVAQILRPNIKKSTADLKGAAFYSMLKKWILSEEELQRHGFPRPHPNGPNDRAKVYAMHPSEQALLPKVEFQRICWRCKETYMVNKEGIAVKQESCRYHWGKCKISRRRVEYTCCPQQNFPLPCCTAKCHVCGCTDYENLRGYVKTLPKEAVPAEEQGIYAIDCEMSYTTMGLELTKVTVVNEDCDVVYETLVKPRNIIIDYNSRLSGITEKDMAFVRTSLSDVQVTLLNMFSDKTIVVGHSLENDFKALKLLHDTVVGTSVMFPHRYGFPKKRSLKDLCSQYLNRDIQNNEAAHLHRTNVDKNNVRNKSIAPWLAQANLRICREKAKEAKNEALSTKTNNANIISEDEEQTE